MSETAGRDWVKQPVAKFPSVSELNSFITVC